MANVLTNVLASKIMPRDIDHWLLEAPITNSWGVSIPFPFLFDGEDGEASALNIKYHGCDRNVIASSLASMYKDGLIDFTIPFRSDELLAALSRSVGNLAKSNSYTLTTKGFAKWELIANPDWTRFARHLPYCESDTNLRIEAATVAAGQDYLNAFLLWDGRPPVAASWLLQSTWRPFPWKTLAFGQTAVVRLPLCQENVECDVGDPWQNVRWIQNPVTVD